MQNRATDPSSAFQSTDDLDEMIATLREGAMQYIIEQSTPGVFTILDLGDTESGLNTDAEPPTEDGLTSFVRSFLKSKRLNLTSDEFRRVVSYFRKEMTRPSNDKRRIRYIDWRDALKSN
jgi:hypothetical protein